MIATTSANVESAKNTNLLLYLIMSCSGALLLTNKIPILAIGAALATVMVGISACMLRRKILGLCATHLTLLLAVYCYLIFSYLASEQPALALASYEFLRHDGNFFFAYAMFFAFASPYLNYRALFSVYHSLLLTVFAVFAILGLVEMVTGLPGVLSSHYMGDFYFTALNKAHNATGSAYAAASVVALSAWLFGDKSPARKRRSLLLLSCCLLGLLMTRSRGSFLAFGVAAAFLCHKRYGFWFLASRRLPVLIVILTLAIAVTGAQHRWVASANYEQDYNIVTRLGLWMKAWHLFKLSPTIGVGFGRFNDFDFPAAAAGHRLFGYPGVAALHTAGTPVYNDAHAHNSYLQFLAETGIIGLGLLLAFWLSLFRRLRRAFNTVNDDTLKLASVLGMANIVLLLSISLTENYLSATTIMLFMSASIGISLGLIGQSDGRRGSTCA